MIGERIKTIRKVLRLNQTIFGKNIGISAPLVVAFEKGQRIPTERTKNDIIRVYGVSPAYLETGEGEMFLQEPKQKEGIRRLIPKLESLTAEQLESIEKLIEAFGKVGE